MAPPPPQTRGPAFALPKGVWGPRHWYRVHLAAINFPPRPSAAQQRDAVRRLWTEVAALPCPECQGHASRYLLATPPDLSSGDAYERWAFTFHNAVNARLGHPRFAWDAYLRLYAQERDLAACGEGCRRALRPPAPGLGPTLALLERGGSPPPQGGLP